MSVSRPSARLCTVFALESLEHLASLPGQVMGIAAPAGRWITPRVDALELRAVGVGSFRDGVSVVVQQAEHTAYRLTGDERRERLRSAPHERGSPYRDRSSPPRSRTRGPTTRCSSPRQARPGRAPARRSWPCIRSRAPSRAFAASARRSRYFTTNCSSAASASPTATSPLAGRRRRERSWRRRGVAHPSPRAPGTPEAHPAGFTSERVRAGLIGGWPRGSMAALGIRRVPRACKTDGDDVAALDRPVHRDRDTPRQVGRLADAQELGGISRAHLAATVAPVSAGIRPLPPLLRPRGGDRSSETRKPRICGAFSLGPARIRTWDQRIMSPLL